MVRYTLGCALSLTFLCDSHTNMQERVCSRSIDYKESESTREAEGKCEGSAG